MSELGGYQGLPDEDQFENPYEGLPDNDMFGFQPPPCPQQIGPDLFEKCGLPRFYFVDELTSPYDIPLRSHNRGDFLFNTGRFEAETFWGNKQSLFSILHYDKNDWQEPLPYEVSEALSECNADELKGSCDDHNHVLQWTCSPSARHLYTSIWVCPPNLDRITLTLFDIVKSGYAANQNENNFYFPSSLELWEIHFVYIRRACIAGQNKISHADIWNSLYVLLRKLDPYFVENGRYERELVSQFYKALIDIEECYGPVCGHKEGELWTAIEEWSSGNWTRGVITLEMARDPDLYPLSKFSSIDDEAAAVLVKSIPMSWDCLMLNGIAHLSDAASEGLGRCGTDLDLCGLMELSDTAATNLSSCYGGLRFDSLTSISDQAAKNLANHKGKLMLNGLTQLSNESAEGLSTHKGSIELLGLTNLSDEAVEWLSKPKGSLYLGITELTDAAAKSLANHEGKLSLSNLTNLQDTAAEILENHNGSVWLNGLPTVSDAAAKSLAQLNGRSLKLNKLETLSNSAAQSLSKFNGNIWLDGLTRLSDEAAESLSKVNGGLFLDGLNSLSDEAANSLGHHEHMLSLRGLTDISKAGAKALANRKKRVLLDLNKLPEHIADIFRK